MTQLARFHSFVITYWIWLGSGKNCTSDSARPWLSKLYKNNIMLSALFACESPPKQRWYLQQVGKDEKEGRLRAEVATQDVRGNLPQGRERLAVLHAKWPLIDLNGDFIFSRILIVCILINGVFESLSSDVIVLWWCWHG